MLLACSIVEGTDWFSVVCLVCCVCAHVCACVHACVVCVLTCVHVYTHVLCVCAYGTEGIHLSVCLSLCMHVCGVKECCLLPLLLRSGSALEGEGSSTSGGSFSEDSAIDDGSSLSSQILPCIGLDMGSSDRGKQKGRKRGMKGKDPPAPSHNHLGGTRRCRVPLSAEIREVATSSSVWCVCLRACVCVHVCVCVRMCVFVMTPKC